MSKGIGERQKIYILDTNVFIADPTCFTVFDNNVIVIPDAVIEELDNNKNLPGDKGYNTREALRKLDQLRRQGSLLNGIATENGGLIRVETEYNQIELPDTWKSSPDNRILKIAKGLTEESKQRVIMVSKDINVRLKADVLGVVSEDYKHEKIEEDHLIYNGRDEIMLSNKDFDKLASGDGIDIKRVKFTSKEKRSLVENEFLIIKNEATMGTLLGRLKDGNIITLSCESNPYGISPRNAGQKFCIEAIMLPAKEVPLVILKGSAGTAKTFLTLACGLEQCVERGIYRKMTITRANVEFDKDIGALPGDETSKVGPLLRGCMDNLELLVDEKSVKSRNGKESDIREKVNYLFDRGYIAAEALGFLRGRSLTRQILYVDEAQNTSISQMKGILTRVGEGTKLVISGDLNQIDNPRLDKHNNGLAYALKLMTGDPLCCVVGFSDKETTRSPLAAKVATLISN